MRIPPAAAPSEALAVEPPAVGGVDIGIVLEVTDSDCVVDDAVMVAPSDVVEAAVVSGLPMLVAVTPVLSGNWSERVEVPVVVTVSVRSTLVISGF